MIYHMKRNCPNCHNNKLIITWFKVRNNLKCQKCDLYFRYSHWQFLYSVCIYLIITYSFIFRIIDKTYILLIIPLLGIYFYLFYRFFPVVETQFEDGIAPTNITFEKTDDVSENIKRYKEAQRIAVEEIRKNQKLD